MILVNLVLRTELKKFTAFKVPAITVKGISVFCTTKAKMSETINLTILLFPLLLLHAAIKPPRQQHFIFLFHTGSI